MICGTLHYFLFRSMGRRFKIEEKRADSVRKILFLTHVVSSGCQYLFLQSRSALFHCERRTVSLKFSFLQGIAAKESL